MKPKMSVGIVKSLLRGANLSCQSPTLLIVSGTVTDTASIPPAPAFVGLISAEDYQIIDKPTLTDENGIYRLTAPGWLEYSLLLITYSGQFVKDYNLHAYTVQMAWLEASSGEVSRDFTLIPCHDFMLEGYDGSGFVVPEDAGIGLQFVENMAGNTTENI